MTKLLSYQINKINRTFKIPIHKEDNVKYMTTRIKKEFGIINKLTAQISGNDLQDTSLLHQTEDVITFND